MSSGPVTGCGLWTQRQGRGIPLGEKWALREPSAHSVCTSERREKNLRSLIISNFILIGFKKKNLSNCCISSLKKRKKSADDRPPGRKRATKKGDSWALPLDAEQGSAPCSPLCLRIRGCQLRKGLALHSPCDRARQSATRPAHSASPSLKPHCPPQNRQHGCTRVGRLGSTLRAPLLHPRPPSALRIVPPWPPQGPDWTRVPGNLLTSQVAQGSTSQDLAGERLKFQKVCQEIHCF